MFYTKSLLEYRPSYCCRFSSKIISYRINIKSINTKYFGSAEGKIFVVNTDTIHGCDALARSICIRVRRSGDDVIDQARARRCVCGKGNSGGGAPGTLNRRDAATAPGGSADRPRHGCDPVTAAVRSAGVALAQGGVRLLSLGRRRVHGTLVAEDTDAMQEFA